MYISTYYTHRPPRIQRNNPKSFSNIVTPNLPLFRTSVYPHIIVYIVFLDINKAVLLLTFAMHETNPH